MKDIIYSVLVVVQIIISLICYIPQFIKILKTKKSEDISVGSIFLRFLSESSYLVLLIMDDVCAGLIILEVIEIIQVLLMISLSIIFSDKHKNRKSRK